jgi:glucose/arabinose dehydrogenase
VESGNRIVRLRFENEQLTEDKILLDNIPKKQFHDGGILRFGPDGYLYAGTGDARDPNSAQDLKSTAGKILRMDRNGDIPSDNPFNNYVWSYGHRNVQGISWDASGNMYASEHGPSGELNGWCCHDELNIIRKGWNYGWPFVIGNDAVENTITPAAHSGEDTWAPGGIAHVGDYLVAVACLRGERLILFDFDQYLHARNYVKEPSSTILYSGTLGRLRNVIAGPDGSVIFCTSNRDGRGDVREGDDKILLVKRLGN